MTKQATPRITDLNERKAIGRAYLNAKRVEEALQVYARILRDYPEDVDAYLFLGDCYLADGDPDTALYLYSQALEYTPTTPEVQRRISMARAQCLQRWSAPAELQHMNILQGKTILSNPQSVISLLQTLTSQPAAVTDGEVVKATQLLDEIVHRSHPAEAVAERLEEIDELLPALIELNIRRAQSEGRADLADALQDLLQDLQAEKTAQSDVEGDKPAGPALPSTLRILFLEPASSELNLPAQALRDLGCQVATAAELPAGGTGQFDAVIAYRPHGDPRLMESLAACAAAKLPIILNLDKDFDQMPLDHPDYETYGLGTPGRAKAYAAALLLANVLRVPGESLAAVFRSSGHLVEVIPDGWSRQNDLWKKPANTRHTLNLGWIGSPGEFEDVFQIRRVILRLAREFPQVRLVIGGDPQVYKLFDTLPEGRCLFLPSVSPDDYPYLLAQVDILFVPLRNTPYNRAASDRRLMEAGVRGIPWVASPVPAFTAWNVGGLIAHTADEWHTNLRQLMLDAGLRSSLGQSGRKRAEIREMEHLGPTWLSLVEETIKQQER